MRSGPRLTPASPPWLHWRFAWKCRFRFPTLSSDGAHGDGTLPPGQIPHAAAGACREAAEGAGKCLPVMEAFPKAAAAPAHPGIRSMETLLESSFNHTIHQRTAAHMRVKKLNSSAVPQHRTEGMTSSDSHRESLLQHLLFVLIILCFTCLKKGTSPSSSSFSCGDISAAVKCKPSLSRRQLSPGDLKQ